MMPLGWYYFNTISLVSPITNFFTIPILSFYLVPFALIQTILFLCGLHVDIFHFWLVSSVDLFIEIVVYIMKVWPLPTHIHKGIDPLAAVTLLIGGFLLVIPRVGPVKVQGVVFIVSALVIMQLPKKPQPTLAFSNAPAWASNATIAASMMGCSSTPTRPRTLLALGLSAERSGRIARI